MERDYEKIARGILRNAAQKEPPTDLGRVLAYLRIHHERPWHLKQDVWESLGRPARQRTRFQGQAQRATAKSRWALAHEIAHHVLHSSEPHGGGNSWQTHELEYEADLLTAALLIPTALLKRSIKKLEKTHEHVDVEELAVIYGVGRQEMEKRLRQLDLLKAEVFQRM